MLIDDHILNLIKKYNHSAIPDNHYAISDLMRFTGRQFLFDNKQCILNVKPVMGIHNVQLYMFWVSEIEKESSQF